ncbi:50S ribosomal protein L30 [Infirmifilum uzonense]|uniref:Large ribosomal subunit protein eL30 n=1 Tax=Infirmifilum uzonense TaxID=1550241 RepID=A0A0F7FH35_9CREN|nr:50S ribosomal protein L30e [Infirmifilum uzonense]AKG38013.1 50S ribosomal protein L30 [Infirmifilum uzonense]
MSSSDLIRELQTVLKTGKAFLGYRRTIKAIINAQAKLVILARNAPSHISEEIKYYASLSQIPVYVFNGSSRELGAACNKPYLVSAIAILDPGESNILMLTQGVT